MFAVSDSLGICSFATTTSYIIDTSSLLELIKAALGVSFTDIELLRAGQRTVVLERCFNLRENKNRDDILPWRLMHQPVNEGPGKGNVNSVNELREMLKRYYKLQGYDQKGRPTREVLSSLELLGSVKGIENVLDWNSML
jgi:aldehyde:ferredoxin oxidoreductase